MMNDQLLQLYSQYWDGMIQHIYKADEESHPAAYPILIQVTQHYQNASKRVMFCGQETFSWGTREYPNPDVTCPAELMRIYNIFVNHNNNGGRIERPGYYFNKLDNGQYKIGKANISPYWNFQWYIMQRNPEIGFVAQNIIKIGKRSDVGCDEFIFQKTKEYFPVWKKELEILHPDCIIFLTGSYDRRIREIAGDFEVCSVDGTDDLLKELRFSDSFMPRAYRTNHPGWLQRRGKYTQIASALNTIICNL